MRKNIVSACACAVLLLVITSGASQAVPRPQTSVIIPRFEVASIKRNTSGSQGTNWRASGGRFVAENVSLRNLLRWSYWVQDFEIAEGANRIDSDHYDIEAKTDINSDVQEMRSMVRGLLQDRFNLVLHHETRELPVYVLTVAKEGSKLKTGACITQEPNTPPAPGQRPSAYCGWSGIGNNNFQGTGVPVTILADYLGAVLKRKVVDKTALVGTFDVSLRWAPDGVSTGNPTVPSTDSGGPSIFTAIQEQLGLKLDSAKGPVEVLVIDQLEKPSEN